MYPRLEVRSNKSGDFIISIIISYPKSHCDRWMATNFRGNVAQPESQENCSIHDKPRQTMISIIIIIKMYCNFRPNFRHCHSLTMCAHEPSHKVIQYQSNLMKEEFVSCFYTRITGSVNSILDTILFSIFFITSALCVFISY